MGQPRRIIENTFGILVAKWRIFKSEVTAIPRKNELYVKATVVLHNFQQKSEQCVAPEERQCCPPSLTDGDEEKDWAYNKKEAVISIDMQKILMLPRMPRIKNYIFTRRLAQFHQTFAPLGGKSSALNLPQESSGGMLMT